MQSTGIVGEKGLSKNGKPKVNIDGAWYFSGRCSTDILAVGTRIDFEWNEFGDGPRKMKGLESWTLSSSQPSAEEVEAAKNKAKPQGGFKGGGFGRPQVSEEAYVYEAELRFISNVVGQAIAKGSLTTPEEIARWTKHTRSALNGLKATGAAVAEPVSSTSTTPQASNGNGQSAPKGETQYPLRPTGNFGFGKKFKDTPWHAMSTDSLQWFSDQATMPVEVKKNCGIELWYRRQANGAPAPAAGPGTPLGKEAAEPEFDDDIPF